LTARARLPIAIATSALMAIGGCGSNGDAKSGTTSLSKAEFVQLANAACRREKVGLAQRVAEFERLRNGMRPAPYGDMVHRILLPTIEEEVSKIRELTPPHGEEERVDWMLFAQQSAIDNVAVRRSVPSIAAAARHFAGAGRLLRGYGLSDCVFDPRAQQGSAA
jgi:hypothetical protein